MVFLTLGVAAYAGISSIGETQIESYIVGDGVNFTVGVISDTNIGRDELSYNNLVDALRTLRNNNVNLIIHAGNITDNGSEENLLLYLEAYDSVYGTAANKPLNIYTMGDRDFITDNMSNTIPLFQQKKYERVLKQSMYSHKIINGVHFIAYSVFSGFNYNGFDTQYKLKNNWAEKQINSAKDRDNEAVIFVITNHAPYNTVYGSYAADSDNGIVSLNDIYKNYNQIISLSGHYANSPLDERTIFQDKYTAINVGSLSEINVRGEKQPNQYPILTIMKISSTNIAVDRLNAKSGVKLKASWIIDLPLNRADFKYDNTRLLVRDFPVFNIDSNAYVADNEIVFSAAYHSDYINNYYLVYESADGEKYNYTYSSDFYKGLANMASVVTLPVENLPQGVYSLSIYGVESYGKMTEAPLVIDTIEIE